MCSRHLFDEPTGLLCIEPGDAPHTHHYEASAGIHNGYEGGEQ